MSFDDAEDALRLSKIQAGGRRKMKTSISQNKKLTPASASTLATINLECVVATRREDTEDGKDEDESGVAVSSPRLQLTSRDD